VIGRHDGECGARADNGGLGAEPPAGSRGRAPGQEVRGAKPPEAESILVVGCPTEPANLALFQKCICISTLGATVMIWEKFVEIQGGLVTPLVPSWGRPCLRRQDVLSINVAPCDLCRSLIRILVPYSNVHVKQARTFHKITYIGLSVPYAHVSVIERYA